MILACRGGFVVLMLCGIGMAQKLAITMDDLPLNGSLPTGVTRAETTKNVLEILKKRHVPPVYGFINAKRLEGNEDGAEALKLWAAKEPVGNHTYSHMDLEQNTAEAFEREIEESNSVHLQIEETEPVCDDCEHEFLSWANCPPLC